MNELVEPNGYEAWKLHKRIVELRNGVEATFLELGERLYWFEEKRFYEALGYRTFEAYLASPDVDISRSVAFRLKGIYRDLRLGLRVPPERLLEAGNSKLDMIRPYATEENVDDLLADAETLSKTDLRKQIADRFDRPDLVLHECVCDKCGRRHIQLNEPDNVR